MALEGKPNRQIIYDAIEDHPAGHDQLASATADLISSGHSFLAFILVEKDGEENMHVMLGRGPGVSTPQFLSACSEQLVDLIQELVFEAGNEQD